jgi:hypothetical protein
MLLLFNGVVSLFMYVSLMKQLLFGLFDINVMSNKNYTDCAKSVQASELVIILLGAF